MPFHRLTAQSYLGGLPGTHDFINDPVANGDAGLPATVSAGKITQSGHPNVGSYMVGFGLDGTSAETNRPHEALAENCDFLDDVVSAQFPVIGHVDGVAAAPVSTLVISGDVFMGMTGVYANTQDFRDRLVSVLDTTTLNEVVDASGVKVQVTAIRDNTNVSNRVGAAVSPGGDFETNPTLTFNPPIPAGTNYRIVFAKRSSLVTALRSGTNRDFAVRTAIRSAAEAGAEVVRFMAQAARRTGGNVTALSATTIETPRAAAAPGGSILPPSNTLNIDIDPTAAFAGNGVFNVSFDRDSSPRSLFAVLEGAVGNSVWANVAERIALADANTLASGFANSFVELSSGVATEGDNSLRLLESDPGAEPNTVLKRLNAVWTVTCGDGSNTFGDFNGTTAVSDAIAFWNANPVGSGLRLLLKAGTYTVSSEALTTNGDLIIEGHSRDSCTLSNVATAGNYGLSAIGSFSIVLRNLTISRGSTSNVMVNAGNGYLVVEDVVGDLGFEGNMTGASVEAVRALFNRCSITMGVAAAGTALYQLNTTGGTDVLRGRVVFRDSLLRVDQDAPIVYLNNALGAGTGGVGEVHFERCGIQTAGTTVTGGNPTSPTGLVHLDTGSQEFTYQGVFVRNCQVQVNPTLVGTTHIFEDIRIDSSNDFLRTFQVHQSKVDFGERASTLTPCIIGHTIFGSSGSNVEEVVFCDVSVGHSGATHVAYGDPPTAFSGPASMSGVFLQARRVKMKRVEWLTASAQPTHADLWVQAAESAEIDSVLITNWVDGAGTSPNARVVLENIATGVDPGRRFNARGIIVRGPAAGLATQVALRVFEFRPNGVDLVAENCVVARLSIGIASSHGFYLPNNDLNDVASGLQLVGCSAQDLTGLGSACFYTNQTGSLVGNLDNTRIERCSFKNSYFGIRLIGAAGGGTPVSFGNMMICGNAITDNSDLGILFGAGAYPSPGSISIVDNVVANNNGSVGANQIQVGGAGALDGDDAVLTMTGNNCGRAGALDWGVIYFLALAPNGTGPVGVVGIETGLVTPGTAGNLTYSDRVFVNKSFSTNESRMLQNLAQLQYDI